MKRLTIVRSKSAAAGLAFAVATTVTIRAAVINVPADYSTIQTAVDAAASGDEIQIAAGVYTEQVVIANKNLTLSGSPGAVLRATPGMQQSLAPNSFFTPLLGIFESEVVVSGMTFEGERLGDSQTNDFIGIQFLAASGRVEDCLITGFRGSTLATGFSLWGLGISANNPHRFGVGSVDIQVLRSTFAENTVSIELFGDAPAGPNAPWNPDLLSTTFTVDDNTIVGNGPDATGRQNGIEIHAGAGGEVKRNIITDYAYTGTAEAVPFSFGIQASDSIDFDRGAPLAALQPVQYEGNILLNNQIDTALLRADDSTIVNNSFEGTAPGYRAGGLYFSGDNVKVVANRFSEMDTGVLLFGNDWDYGTFLGITTDAILFANQFCGVADPIHIEELVTGTKEQANQLDACY